MRIRDLGSHFVVPIVLCLLFYIFSLNQKPEDLSPKTPFTLNNTKMSLVYDQFILFGDSLFQHSSSQERGYTLAPALQAGACKLLMKR